VPNTGADLGRLDGGGDRLGIAHLADQDDVGPGAGTNGCPREAPGMDPDVALHDQRLVGVVHELDGILERDDAAVAVGVDLADERGERRRLAAARPAGDEDQPRAQPGELGQHGRQAEVGQARNVIRDHRQMADSPSRRKALSR
jgi:hypothetical protein